MGSQWVNDLFVSCDQLTAIAEEEEIEGNEEFEAKTGLSREAIWHMKNGRVRYMPIDKADLILTRMGCVHRFNELTVYTREREDDGFKYRST